MLGKLILVPTPIEESTKLDSHTLAIIQDGISKNAVFAIEDLKPGRRRWLRYGLPREQVEHFVLYNEHTREETIEVLIAHLKSGRDVFLMSDAGLPAFCDPGKHLVDRAHQLGAKVTATPFFNSVILAVALSGFDHERFVFEGFLPAKDPERESAWKHVANEKRTVVLMDTPYRLVRMLEECAKHCPDREICLAVSLNDEGEEVVRGKAKTIVSRFSEKKLPFVLVLSPNN